jgi:hypothetical protein
MMKTPDRHAGRLWILPAAKEYAENILLVMDIGVKALAAMECGERAASPNRRTLKMHSSLEPLP